MLMIRTFVFSACYILDSWSVPYAPGMRSLEKSRKSGEAHLLLGTIPIGLRQGFKGERN